MSTEEKSIRIIEFSGKQGDWDGWSEKFLARAKRKGYKKLLLGTEKVPTQEQIELAETSTSAPDKKIIKLGELNELAYEDIVLSINHTSSAGKVAFSLIKNCKSDEFPEGNCRMAWERLVKKYEPHTAPKLLKLKKELMNMRLDDVSKDPDEWITDLENIRVQINQIDLVSKMSERDLMIHIMNSLPEQYDPVIDNLEIRLMKDVDDENYLTLDHLREKLSDRYARIMDKEERRDERDKGLRANDEYFKGTCHQCGKYGHRKQHCPENRNEQEKRIRFNDSKQPSTTYDNRRNGRNGRTQHPRSQRNQQSRTTAETISRHDRRCLNCGKVGHSTWECRSEKAQRAIEDDDNSYEPDYCLSANTKSTTTKKVTFDDHVQYIKEKALVCTINGRTYPSFTKNTWIGDSGASCHITNNDSKMYDVKNIDETVSGVSGGIQATKIGKVNVQVKQVNGATVNTTLSQVKYCPEATENLFSITSELSNGCKLKSNEVSNIVLTKGKTRIEFDRRMKTKNGWLGGVEIIPVGRDTAKYATPQETPEEKSTPIKIKDVNELHRELGHPNEGITRATGKSMGYQVVGTYHPCESCLMAKARQANVNKLPTQRSTIKGERLFIDISSPNTPSLGGKTHWLLIVDDCTGYTWSYFLRQKRDLPKTALKHIRELK